MPVKSKRVNLSVSPSQERGILNVGRQNRLHSTDGSLRITTICAEIIYFILDIFNIPKVQAYLEKSGGTLFDLIRRAVNKYVEENDE